MQTNITTGFCRLTVAGSERRVDLALPDDVPLADLYPEVLRLSRETLREGEPAGFHLVRRDGSVLDPALSLAAQRVLDGELLLLRPFSQSLPAPVYDDVVEAVAAAVQRDLRRWRDGQLLFFGLASGVLLLSMTALVLWFADPVRHVTNGLPGIIATVLAVLLIALAGVRARIYDDRWAAIALGLGALPHALIAGSALLPLDAGQGPGRMQLLTGSAAAMIAAVLLIALLPRGDAPFVSAALLGAVGMLVTFGSILTGCRPREAAAVAGVAAIGLIGFLPGFSARFAQLPIGFRNPQDGEYGTEFGDSAADQLDAERIAAQARRGHELLLGLVGGCAAVIVCAGGVLGFSDSSYARLLALALGLAALMRARLFRLTGQVASLLASGTFTLCLLALGLAIHPPLDVVRAAVTGVGSQPEVRVLWLSGSVALVAAVLTAIGMIVPRKGLTPLWGRLLEALDATVLLALVPLCLGVLDLYAKARGMTS